MDRYDKIRKNDRNQMLEEYADNHPEATYTKIGELFGISKQRVSELLKIAKERKNKKAVTGEQVTARQRS